LFLRLKLEDECKVPSIALIHSRHSINSKFITIAASSEIEVVPEVLGNLLNVVGKTRYRNGPN
jgi:hypothetical protein